MDEQHKRLIGLINTMYQVMRKEEGPEVIGKVLDEMDAYVDTHLREEEAFLQEHGYAESDKQQSFHEDYRKKMVVLRADWEKGESLGVQNIYTFLRHWWLRHIVEEDSKYGPFLAKKGVR